MPTKQVTVGTAPVTLVNADPNRNALAFHNSHAAQILFVSDEPGVSATTGFFVQPTTSLLLSEIEGIDVTKKWEGVSDGAGTVVGVLTGNKVFEVEIKADIQDPNQFHDPPA